MASHVAISREKIGQTHQSKMVPSSKEGSKNLSSLHAMVHSSHMRLYLNGTDEKLKICFEKHW
jgi:hypothetical protein